MVSYKFVTDLLRIYKSPTMKHEPVIIERVYEAPVDRVWKAISDRDEMKKWYFNVSDFRPEVGFQFQFEGHNEGRTFIHLCTVMEVIRGSKLKYSWTYQGYEGASYVTWELFPEGDKTRLRLTHEGLETFPASPDFARESFLAGWTALIGDLLPAHLSGKNVPINP